MFISEISMTDVTWFVWLPNERFKGEIYGHRLVNFPSLFSALFTLIRPDYQPMGLRGCILIDLKIIIQKIHLIGRFNIKYEQPAKPSNEGFIIPLFRDFSF